jgi:polar amino acid transport system permease protein
MPSFSHFIQTFIESSPLFLKGAVLTIELSIASVGLGLIIGLGFALMSLSPVRALRLLSSAYITLVRGTPLVVQIFVLYFGLTEIVQLTSFAAATWALAFHNGAYLSEIFRGAIQSIDRGQSEAALSLGMNPLQTFSRIVFPQAMLRALPPLGNQFIIALKDSSLAAFISMNELFSIATTQGSNNFDQMTYLLIVAVYYLVLVMILTFLVSLLERYLKRTGAT